MPAYIVTFPATATVWAENEDDAKEKAVSRANFNFFANFEQSDIISMITTDDYKECPKCKFYTAPIDRDVCYECRRG